MAKDFADPRKHWPILRRLTQMEDETNSERLKASLSFRKDLLVATTTQWIQGWILALSNQGRRYCPASFPIKTQKNRLVQPVLIFSYFFSSVTSSVSGFTSAAPSTLLTSSTTGADISTSTSRGGETLTTTSFLSVKTRTLLSTFKSLT